MAVRINWKNVENLSYIFFSFAVAGLIQFGIILFAFYFLPIISPFILILVPLGATFLNCGSAILFAEFFIQNRHKKIVQKKYKKPIRELTPGFALLISNFVIIGMSLLLFFAVIYFYMLYVPNNQIRQILFGLVIPIFNINVYNLPAFLSFMAADLGSAVAPFLLAILFDIWGKRPFKIKKRKTY
ncbi:MAG: hypothetical protein HWN67_13620 [Candidatus Helarchaeota archaeon]|nr:hypothetical protein [Candidatus Helarchaeota archaeon]